MICASCGSAVADDARFCPSCGRSVSADATIASGADETLMTPPSGPPSADAEGPATPGSGPAAGGRAPSGAPASPHTSGSGLHSGSGLDSRFAPGTMIAERYRLVGLLGKGGMGEVYRADDLTLGPSVALKFLPEGLSGDAQRLDLFFQEVRTAREIAHPNVCRVYDIGEYAGQTFLSMEYVDGDDLSSLLRRIGRVPAEKAVEISRQLCAGLAALHDRGILHRDLKPSNIMVDGRGRVRITDFGLAVPAAADLSGQRVGTPAYMAPEQIDGRNVDERADIYALGLVLYEIFTGKRAFEADTFAELAALQREGTPTNPSTIIADLDPAVERLLARCLEKDPDSRPPSAIAVAAALPGGDPLAEALAAGEVPSLEMVAAAGERGGVTPLQGGLAVAAVLTGVILYATVNVKEKLYHYVPPEKPSAVLEDRAREISDALGYDEPIDRSFTFTQTPSHRVWLQERAEEDSVEVDWHDLAGLRPGPLVFGYRQSTDHLVPVQPRGFVTADDPAPTMPGMTRLVLDTEGYLIVAHHVPPWAEPDSVEGADADAPRGPPDWTEVFALAGLEYEGFRPVEPEWVPRAYADARFAWLGSFPETPDSETRVEAATYRNEVVYFRVIGEWSEKPAPPQEARLGERAFIIFFLALITGILALVVFLVIRNLRLGRGDIVGARRIALAFFLIGTGIWVLSAHHVQDFNDELNLFLSGLAPSLMIGALTWTFYLALEPYARKTWPALLVGWSRLITGRYRDPLVGRDILAGGIFFLFYVAVQAAGIVTLQLMGKATAAPGDVRWEVFVGANYSLSWILGWLINSAFYAFFILLLLMVFRTALRNRWAAAAAFCAVIVSLGLGIDRWLFALLLPLAYVTWRPPERVEWAPTVMLALFIASFMGFSASSGAKWVGAAQGLVLGAAWAFVLVRYGLVTFIIGLFFRNLMNSAPITLDPGVWWSSASFLVIAAILLVTGYGLYIGLRGNAQFGEPG